MGLRSWIKRIVSILSTRCRVLQQACISFNPRPLTSGRNDDDYSKEVGDAWY